MNLREANELKTLLERAPRLTLAVAESLTSGQVQARVGACSGASEFFLGGITAYTPEQKARHLGVDLRAAKKADGVSVEIARQMAIGAAKLFGSDLALATTGYAEPSKARGVRAPFAHWAFVHRRRGRIVAAGEGMVVGEGLKRVEMQAAVTDVVLAELLAYVRALRS